MSDVSKLAKETVIYGLSSILGRFLNWCLVPLYSYVLTNVAEYGIVTNLYSWTALVIVIITYGMETGFFRFVNADVDDEKCTNRVYSTTLTSIATTSVLFATAIVLLRAPIASALGYSGHEEFIALLGVIVSLDAFNSIPFSYLRYKNKPIVFASLKLFMIFINISCNLFFLVGCPRIMLWHPEYIDWFYNPTHNVTYILISNLASSGIITLALLPYVVKRTYTFDWQLLKRMLAYCWPLLLLGVAGIMNQTVDKIIFPMIYPDKETALAELGIYGASFKVAMIMMMFTNAFRFAYEPFIFAKNGSHNSKEAYADAMKFFIITALLILLGMVFYIDLLQYILGPDYRKGLAIIPIVLITYLIQGVVYNLSLWYKLIDKTWYGAIFSIVGFVITIAINLIFIPIYSYWACAFASLVCYIVMLIMSYVLGQRHYPIAYDLKKIGIYTLLAAALWAASAWVNIDSPALRYAYRTALLSIFIIYLIKNDLPIGRILKSILKKH